MPEIRRLMRSKIRVPYLHPRPQNSDLIVCSCLHKHTIYHCKHLWKLFSVYKSSTDIRMINSLPATNEEGVGYKFLHKGSTEVMWDI